MADNFASTKEHLEKLIEQASTSIEYINVCSIAFDLCRPQTQKQHNSLFMWFVERAENTWCHRISSESSDEFNEFIQRLGFSDSEATDLEDMQDSSIEYLNDLGLTEDDVLLFHAKYKKLIEGIIDSLSCEGMPVSKYYSELYKILFSFFDTKNASEQGFCLYAVIMDKRTPYYEIKPGITMSNDQFRSTVDSIEPQLNKMMFILNLSHAQRTETASQLLSVLDELDSTNMKSVFLSQLLARIQLQDKVDSK